MADVNWKRYVVEFDLLTETIRSGNSPQRGIGEELRCICIDDPSCEQTRLGVESYLIAFLEFLFFKAEGPYSPNFLSYADVISKLFSSSENLRFLINRNAVEAIANMVLNKRGKLKFLIADHLELMAILEWWPRFGLNPVTGRQVFEVIVTNPPLCQRLQSGDPGLILRLLEVFPEFRNEFYPDNISRENLARQQAGISPLPSYRRYNKLYSKYLREGRDLVEIIRMEELRILPVQVRRNTFLAFLVKKLHGETCQICSICGAGERDPVITVHHIVPLSEGGEDKAMNMMVVCLSHHQAIHDGRIQVSITDKIHVICQNGSYTINSGRIEPG